MRNFIDRDEIINLSARIINSDSLLFSWMEVEIYVRNNL